MAKKPVVDFDHNSREYAADKIGVLRAARELSPVAWTEAHGGFWVVTGYEEMRTVTLDTETFSSRYEPDTIFQGLAIPTMDMGLLPETLDPPESYAFRKFYTGRLTPRVAEEKRERFRQLADYCIDRRITSGRIELMNDLAVAVPSMVTMEILGIPLDDWRKYAEPVHEWAYTPIESADRQRVVDGFNAMFDVIRQTIENRKQNPTDDLISQLTRARVRDGEHLTDAELLQMASIIVLGGVETTTTLLGNVFLYLDEHPEARKRMLEDPEFMVSAREEFLRFYSPVGGHARTVTRTTEIAGSKLERGDRVFVSWMGANHDPREFENPDEVILDRFPNRHCAFGMGVHRCLGSNVARAEYEVILEQLLRRLPDYRVEREGAEPYPSQINPGWIAVPATFTPGMALGATL